MKRWWLLFAGLGCASPGAPDTRRELLENWSTALIVPTYAEFQARSEALSRAVDEACAAPGAATLEAARTTWSEAREPWKQAEVFAFGPYSRPEFRIGPKIDTWPARPEEVEALLAGEAPVDAAAVESLGVYHKGLPVLEYLLYAPDDPVAALGDARRCSYLKSVGVELVNRAREMHEAWSPEGGDFAGQLSGAGRTSTAFRTLRDAFGEIVNRIGFTIENIRRLKIGRPLGEETGGTPRPDAVESPFSGRSARDILDNLDGIELLYFGDPERGVEGLRRYAEERGQNFDSRVSDGLAAVRAALSGLDMPLSRAVVDAPSEIQAAQASLAELQSLFQVDVIGALGLSLDFNDNDGD